MIEKSTNGTAHRPVNRAGTPRGPRASDVAERQAAPNHHGHAEASAAAAAASRNGDNGEGTAPPKGKEGRDARGRFAPGNAGGPGNPFARRVAQFRRVLCETVTDEDIQAVAVALIAKAKEGDVAAARLLFSYTIGQPAPAVDPDTLDLAEWDIYRRTPAKVEDLQGFVGGMPAALACKLAGILTPCVYDRAAKTIAAELRADDTSAAAPAGVGHKEAGEPARPPSTNGANGSGTRRGRTAPRPLRKRDQAAQRKRKEPAEREDAPTGRQRTGGAAPSTNGANGHSRMPCAPG